MKTLSIVLIFLSLSAFSQTPKVINIDNIANSYLEMLNPAKYKFQISGTELDTKVIEIKFEKGNIPPFQLPSGVKKSGVAQDLTTLQLSNGDKVEFIITDSKVASFKKTVVYQVPQRGTWNTTFGFCFIRDIFTSEAAYFATPTGKPNEYEIMRGKNPNRLFFTPSVFFSWMPAKKENDTWYYSLTGGIGVQGNATPTVFLGGGLFFNRNIGINLGLAAHQINFLKPEYEAGKKIISSTTPDLQTKAYRINPFISISLRFNENPFNK